MSLDRCTSIAPHSPNLRPRQSGSQSVYATFAWLKVNWYKFELPSVSDGEWNETYGCRVKTLTEKDLLDSWTTPLQNYIQGACVYDGLIWSTEGFTGSSGVNLARMRVIDPSKKSEIAVFNFFSDGDPVEPEFIEFYNGSCYYGNVQQTYILELM